MWFSWLLGALAFSTCVAMELKVISGNKKNIEVKWKREDEDPDKLSLAVVDWRDKESDRNPSTDDINKQYLSHLDGSTGGQSLPQVRKGEERTAKITSKVDGLVLLVGFKTNDVKDIRKFAFVTVGESPAQIPNTPKTTTAPPAPTTTASPPENTSTGTTGITSASESQPVPTGTSNETPDTSVSPPLSATTDTQPVGGPTFSPSPTTVEPSSSGILNPGPLAPSSSETSSPPAILTTEQRPNRGLVVGLSVALPLVALIFAILAFLFIRRRRKLERRRLHLEQSAAFASTFKQRDSQDTDESAGNSSNPQSIFAKHFRMHEKDDDTGSSFNPARMVARAWSVKTGSASRISLAPSATFESDARSFTTPGLHTARTA